MLAEPSRIASDRWMEQGKFTIESSANPRGISVQPPDDCGCSGSDRMGMSSHSTARLMRGPEVTELPSLGHGNFQDVQRGPDRRPGPPAMGMTWRQVKRMIRIESRITALIGFGDRDRRGSCTRRPGHDGALELEHRLHRAGNHTRGDAPARVLRWPTGRRAPRSPRRTSRSCGSTPLGVKGLK
jgi:hypothetical protein